jgi:hypothetical protein
MSRLNEIPRLVRTLAATCLLFAPLSAAFADESEVRQTDHSAAKQQAIQLSGDLAGSRLGNTPLATSRPEFAETLLLLLRDLADDSVLDETESQDLMTTAEELCEAAELACRQVKRALRRDARDHANRVEHRVAQWIADGTLPAEPTAQQIRDQVGADRAKPVDEELVVTAPRDKNRYARKSQLAVYRAFNSRRLGIWHYNKAASHERAARRHDKQGRRADAEAQFAEALREFEIAFPYLLTAAQQGLKWPAAMIGYLYLSGKGGEQFTPPGTASAEAAIGWLGLAASDRSTHEIRQYFEKLQAQIPESRRGEVDEIVSDYVATWGPRAQGAVCRHGTDPGSAIRRFSCFFPSVGGPDPFRWEDPVGVFGYADVQAQGSSTPAFGGSGSAGP